MDDTSPFKGDNPGLPEGMPDPARDGEQVLVVRAADGSLRFSAGYNAADHTVSTVYPLGKGQPALAARVPALPTPKAAAKAAYNDIRAAEHALARCGVSGPVALSRVTNALTASRIDALLSDPIPDVREMLIGILEEDPGEQPQDAAPGPPPIGFAMNKEVVMAMDLRRVDRLLYTQPIGASGPQAAVRAVSEFLESAWEFACLTGMSDPDGLSTVVASLAAHRQASALVERRAARPASQTDKVNETRPKRSASARRKHARRRKGKK